MIVIGDIPGEIREPILGKKPVTVSGENKTVPVNNRFR